MPASSDSGYIFLFRLSTDSLLHLEVSLSNPYFDDGINPRGHGVEPNRPESSLELDQQWFRTWKNAGLLVFAGAPPILRGNK